MSENLINTIQNSFQEFDKMVDAAEEVLTGSASIWGTILNLSNSLKPFCYIIIAICLLIEIAQVFAKVDMLRWEHGMKLGVKLVFSKVCIDIAPKFLKACYEQAADWISKAAGVGSNYGMSALVSDQVRTQLESAELGILVTIGLYATLIIVVIAIRLCGLIIQVMAFGRMFEIYVYLAVSPLPCAFFPLGDGSGGGMSRITGKFFKSFIAVCLQGVMMMLCIKIFGEIMGQAFSEMVADAAAAAEPATVVEDMCYSMLMGAICLCLSISRCGSWAKGIIDAM